MPCWFVVNPALPGNYTIQNGQITMRFNIHGASGGLPEYEITGLYGDPLMGGQGRGLPGTSGAYTPPFIWRAVRTR
jgi:hypothetical protein